MTNHAPPPPRNGRNGRESLVCKIGGHKEVRSCPDNEVLSVQCVAIPGFSEDKVLISHFLVNVSGCLVAQTETLGKFTRDNAAKSTC